MKNTWLFLIVISIFGCSQRNSDNSAQTIEIQVTPVVYVSNYPLYYFAGRIAGSSIDLRFPAEDMNDPSGWVPGAETIENMQGAQLILINGASFEGWLMNVSLPDSIIVDTSEALTESLLPSGEVFTHSHGEEGEHAHEGTASTTWLNLTLAEAQAAAVKDALIQIRPDRTEEYEKNYQMFSSELKELDEAFRDTAVQGRDQYFIFSHPVYQYFQQAYGLEGQSLHWEPGNPLTHEMMHEIEHLKEDHNPGFLIWEKTPLAESAEKLREQGIESIVIDPMGGTPTTGDFMEGMRKNHEALRTAFSGSIN